MKTENASPVSPPYRRRLLAAVAAIGLLAATFVPMPALAAPLVQSVRAAAPPVSFPPLLRIDDHDDDDDDDNDDDDDDGDDGDQDDDDNDRGGGGMTPGGGTGGMSPGGGRGETGGGSTGGGATGDEGDDDDEDEDEDDDGDRPAPAPVGGSGGSVTPGGSTGGNSGAPPADDDDDDDDDNEPAAPAAPPSSAPSPSSGGSAESSAPSSGGETGGESAPASAPASAPTTAATTTTTTTAAAGGNDDRFTPAAAEATTPTATAAADNNADIFGDAVLDPDEVLDPLGQVARRGEILALTASAQLPALAQGLGLTILGQQTVPGINETLARLRVPNALTAEDAIDTLRDQDPGGSYEFNHVYDLEQARRNSREASPRGAATTAPAGSIGMIDTAIDRSHPSLARSVITTRDFLDRAETAARGHCTAVASLLVGVDGERFSGLSPQRKLIAASVFRQSDSGKITASAESLALAIGWMIEQQTPVINMSLAGPPNEVLERVILRALERGHIIVAAVGNAGPAAPPQFPAAYEGVIGVSAVDRDGRVYRRAGRGDHVDFAALGVDVLTADGVAYAPQTGTSFAAPFVSAALADALPAPDRDRAAAALDSLRRQTLDVGVPGRDPVFGDGIYRLPEALAGGSP